MSWFVDLLSSQSLLLLFFVATIGNLIGKISIKGISFGVSAILFVGLATSAINPKLVLPSAFGSLGLVIFVYSIGIASGSSFVNSLKKGGTGRRNNLIVLSVILVGGALVSIFGLLLGLKSPMIAGLFTGSITNTPALAGVVQAINNSHIVDDLAAASTLAVVGYSVAYPMGVIGPITAITFWQRRFKINYNKDSLLATDTIAANRSLHSETVTITNPIYHDVSLKNLMHAHHWHVVFGRVRRGDEEWLATSVHRHVKVGDQISVLGAPTDVRVLMDELGEKSKEELDLDLTQYDRHRIIISNPMAVGRKIRDLHLPQKYGAMITRVKRGDIDMLADKNFILEFGDRVRVLMPGDNVAKVRKYLGDSYKDVSDINILGIGIGMCLGLVLGSMAINMPGGIVLKLGEAGGPLVVGLLLGFIHRTGRIVWGIPYTANLTIREFGLILMLATIGTRSGQTFVTALSSANGLPIFFGAAAISLIVPFIVLPILYKKFKMPFAVATGIMAAIHTQPAVHAYAVQQAKNELPNHGYALTFPTAAISKIIIAQIILLVLL